MWLIDFVVMDPGGSICLITEKIIDINMLTSTYKCVYILLLK